MMFGEHPITNTVCSLSLQAFLQLLCFRKLVKNLLPPVERKRNEETEKAKGDTKS